MFDGLKDGGEHLYLFFSCSLSFSVWNEVLVGKMKTDNASAHKWSNIKEKKQKQLARK